MRESMYSNQIIPAVASYPTQNGDCCNSATGAGAASDPQQQRSARTGIAGELSDAASGLVGDVAKVFKRGGGRGCRCWWVAIAAVVVIALVANK